MASNNYGASILKIVVAQMCDTVGWNSIHSTPLELLTDVLQRYITEVAENTHRYAEQFGHTKPNLHDLGLAFQDMRINTVDLQEYIEYVATIPIQREVPKYPVAAESHLNLLKPGSREVVTRPVHIHEHLPAIHPELENSDYDFKGTTLTVDTSSTSESGSPSLLGSKSNPFKRPGDPASMVSPQSKHARLAIEEEGRPLREITSVMMTTSGFLSPAREGKLPEAHTPTISSLSTVSSSNDSASTSSYPTVPPNVKGEKKNKKKSIKVVKKTDIETKAKDNENVVLEGDDDSKVKKLVGMKELSKLKALKSFKPNSNSDSALQKLPRIPKIKRLKTSGKKKKKVSQIPTKTSNLIPDNISPASSVPKLPDKVDVCEKVEENDDLFVNKTEVKLPSEPDKQKLNIFKKISKAKEEKLDVENVTIKEDSPSDLFLEKSSSKSEVIERSTEQHKINDPERSPTPVPSPSPPSPAAASNTNYSGNAFDSPPGPPRTPEVIIPIKKSKSRKHKRSKTKIKKVKAIKHANTSKVEIKEPEELEEEEEEEELEVIEKPKTPEIDILSDIKIPSIPSKGFPFFENFSRGPGLIPPPISSLFPMKSSLDKQSVLPQHLTQEIPPPKFITSLSSISLPTKPQLSPVLSPSPPPRAHTPPPPPPIVKKEQEVAITLPDVSTDEEMKLEIVEKSSSSKEKLKEDKKKEHKTDKKDRIKKKKHKKEKQKNKDELLKKKEKSREKKEKRREERKREKEKEQSEEATNKQTPSSHVNLPKIKLKQQSSSNVNVPKIKLKLAAEPPQPTASESSHRKIVIKPVKKPEEQEKEEKKEPNPKNESHLEVTKTPTQGTVRPTKPKSKKSMSATSTVPSTNIAPDPPSTSSSTHSSSSKPRKPPSNKIDTSNVKPKKQMKEGEKNNEAQPYYYDDKGNQVWICPACRGPDDGSPMIGCDDCDAWYHWVCVGLQVPPESNDWFCRVCIGKKGSSSGDKKKKIRKKK